MGAADAVMDFGGDILDAGADLVSGAVDAVGDVVDTTVTAVTDAGSAIDDFVNEEIPGGWVTVIGGTTLLAPELLAGEALAGDAVVGDTLVGDALTSADAGTWLGEGVISGIPEWDAAYTTAGGTLAGAEAAGALTTDLTGYDAAMTDLAASAPITDAVVPAELTGYDAAMSDLAASAPISDAIVPADLTGYDAAMADLAASAPAVSSTLDGSGLLAGAAAGAAGAALASDLLTPEIPAAPTYPAKTYTPDWSAKFDAPVTPMEASRTFNYQLSNEPSPYLTRSETGQFVGPMLFDPNDLYASALVKELRLASNAPGSESPGFVLFQSAKP